MRYPLRTSDSASVSAWGKIPTSNLYYGVATGGTSADRTIGGSPFKLLTFTGDGTLTVSKEGAFDILMIGGGSSGETSWNSNGRPGSGGGGSGGYLQSTVYLVAGSYALVVGAGGAAPVSQMSYAYGTASTMKPTSLPAFLVNGSASGKGAAPAWSGGATAPYPLQGGLNGGAGTSTSGGGGGGLGSAGYASTSGTGGAGGDGMDISAWLGQAALTTRVGGGGGGASNTQGFGVGGSGGGGGASPGTGTVNGGANTGGGGRAGSDTDAGSGGSGIIYVRYRV